MLTMLALLTILALCLDNLKQYQTVGDNILINELILVSRADSASKKLPHLDNLFYQPQLKQEFEQDSSAEENVNSKTNEQARKSKQPIKQQSGD